VELDCQAAEARGAAGAEALAKELRNDLQKMGNEANEIKVGGVILLDVRRGMLTWGL
jgi:methylmalonyl-CoA mutase cobalamin-binding subunit